MNFKSQKGYSLIEIGVGVIIITVFLACSIALFNGCFNTYRAIQQRNHVVKFAVNRIETALNTHINVLLPDPSEVDLIDEVKTLSATSEGRAKLAEGMYAVPEDKVEGGFINSPATNNMRITTKIRRLPSDGDVAYDNTVAKITVVVEYTIKPQRPGMTEPAEVLTYEVNALKVTNRANPNKDLSGNLDELSIGSFVEYTPNASVPEDTEWRVWSRTANSVTIIPTTPLNDLKLGYNRESDDDMTKRTECFNDYSTAVKQIEAVCDDYASSALNVTTADVRSLSLADLENPIVSTLASQKSMYSGGVGYNNTHLYTTGNYFGAKYNATTNENNITPAFIMATPENSVILKQDYYYSNAPEWKPLSEGSLENYGTLLGNESSWIASTSVFNSATNATASFNVDFISSDLISPYRLFVSNGETYNNSVGVRPLITLKSSAVKVDTTEGRDGTSAATAFRLTAAQ